MRVVPKLTLAFILSTSAVLAINGLLRVQREVAVYERDRTRDHRLMGFALGETIAAVWRSDGEARALAVLAHVNSPDARIHFRWVWLDDLNAMPSPPLDPKSLREAPEGVPRSVVWSDAAGVEARYTFVPLRLDPYRAGALELTESLNGQHRFIRRTVLDTILTTAML